MALPAGGATLCWLLVMTLWLPVLNFARSYEPLVVKVRSMMGDVQCVHYYGLTRAQGAAFEYHGKLKLLPAPTIASGFTTKNPECDWLIVDTQAINTLGKDLPNSMWQYQATVRRPSDNNEDIVLYKKQITSSVTKP